VVLDRQYSIQAVKVSTRGTSFNLTHNGERHRVTTPLLGAYQARNTATAVATVAALGDDYLPPASQISRALGTLFLPGRFQRRGRIVFDVAHNPAGARTVAKTIADLNLARPRTALVAVLSDKDWRGIIQELAPAIDRFLFTTAPSAPEDRRWNPKEASDFAKGEGLDAESEPSLDVALAKAQKGRGTLLVTGSFHTVGDVMARLHVSPFAA
jgi:dihydrofolate synthase/folylpolyglutamate synthase